MAKASNRNGSPDRVEHRIEHPSHRILLPGFITDADIGLGDVIKRTTSYIGIRPCSGCQRRAAELNRWVAFTRGAS